MGEIKLLTAENSVTDVSLRRYKKELSTAGGGYILFGLWSVLKVIMSVLIGDLSLGKLVDMQQLDQEVVPFFAIFYFVIVGVMAIAVLLLHFYVGLGAIRASSGSRKRGYLKVAFVLAIANMISMLAYVWNIGNLSIFNISDTTIASFLVDLTITIILIDILRSANKIKNLTMEKGMGKQGT
jgi:magnesium-transporting ATPase (P-type)